MATFDYSTKEACVETAKEALNAITDHKRANNKLRTWVDKYFEDSIISDEEFLKFYESWKCKAQAMALRALTEYKKAI